MIRMKRPRPLRGFRDSLKKVQCPKLKRLCENGKKSLKGSNIIAQGNALG